MPPPRDDRYICITPTPSHADSEGDEAGGEPVLPHLLVLPMWDVSKWGVDCQKLPPGPAPPRCVMDFVPIFQGTPLGEVALIREPALLQVTQVPTSVLLHL